jgi:polysaccharide chain length determinant protein (PEP-CTERM system associated)
MLPGKVYTPATILALLWKRKWIVLLPSIATAAAAFFYSSRLPNQYQAETLILVVPQRVPETFIRSTVTMRIEDRLRTISQQILSRTRLEQIIEEMNLYPEQRRRQPLDDVVAHMRDRVVIGIVRGDSFRLSFTYSEPTATMRVTDRLAKDFITDNTRERQAQAEGTSQFLEGQLEDARQRLIEQEKRLEAYRKQHAGTLPTQLPLNMQVIQNTQLQLQALNESINRDRDRRNVVDRLLADLAIAEAAVPAANAADPASVAQLSADQQLDLARQRLTELQNRGLTSEHPDVRAAERKIQDLSAKLEQERSARRAEAQPAPRTPADAARRNQVVQLTAERENLDRQIAGRLADADRLRGVIANYQSRLEMLPTRESELTELTRDYDTLQTTYRSLLAKKEESQIATNLENRQIGEQFRIIDPARLPERPISPNRPVIHAGGVAAGLALGLLVVLALELRDSSLKSEADVVGVLDFPVLALVPIIVTPSDERRSKRIRLLIWGGGTFAVIVAAAGVFVWKAWF